MVEAFSISSSSARARRSLGLLRLEVGEVEAVLGHAVLGISPCATMRAPEGRRSSGDVPGVRASLRTEGRPEIGFGRPRQSGRARQKGFTITMTTMRTRRSVGTSFMMR
jgi:hypothetical protein